jgi:hypothetical protein
MPSRRRRPPERVKFVRVATRDRHSKGINPKRRARRDEEMKERTIMAPNRNITSTTDPVQSTPISTATGKTVKERLAHALGAAYDLDIAAQCLQCDTGGLLSDLQNIAEDSAAPRDIVDVALDAASWLHHATENVEDEFDPLVTHLADALEA